MHRIRILLVDDHAVVRLGLRALLEGEQDMDVVGEAGNAQEALRLASQLQPDIVLLDIRLPDRSGIDVCRDIRLRHPQTQVLMLTSYVEEELLTEAIAAGASGYVLKQLSTDELLHAIRTVSRGDAVLGPKVTRQLLEQVQRTQREMEGSAFHDLSPRELHVLALVAQGKSNAEIAAELMLSPITVRNHVSTILSKLQLSNRIEAATYAVRHHIERYLM